MSRCEAAQLESEMRPQDLGSCEGRGMHLCVCRNLRRCLLNPEQVSAFFQSCLSLSLVGFGLGAASPRAPASLIGGGTRKSKLAGELDGYGHKPLRELERNFAFQDIFTTKAEVLGLFLCCLCRGLPGALNSVGTKTCRDGK